MSPGIDDLFAQVMQLDQSARAEFAERLLDSINAIIIAVMHLRRRPDYWRYRPND